MKVISTEEIEEIPLPTFTSFGEVQVPKKLGRPEGKTITRLEKEIIAVESNTRIGVSQKDIAQAMGTSQTEVSIVEKGIDRSLIEGRKEDEDLKALGLQAKHKIIDLATTKLFKTLDTFEPDGLENKDKPRVSAQLASVVDKLTEKGPQVLNQTQFVVYQPRPSAEEDFEVINLNEK